MATLFQILPSAPSLPLKGSSMDNSSLSSRGIEVGIDLPLQGKPAGVIRPQRQHLVRLLLALALVLTTFIYGPAAYAQGNVHVVQRGESLGTIAQRYNVSQNDLARTNGITNPNLVYVGQRLVIPGRGVANAASATGDGYYTVQRGNTLSQIAQRHGMSVNELMRLNGLSNPNHIQVGQKLRVSARAQPLPSTGSSQPSVANTIYVVKAGDNLSKIAQRHNTTVEALMAANGLPNPNHVWIGQRLRVTGGAAASGVATTNAPANGAKWIEVNLTKQTLTAWQGNVAVLHTSVSTGTSRTPTVTGRFKVGTKYTSQHMSGPGYSLPGVPWVMYFYGAYAIHGTYWHSNFGTPMSRGCVNMRSEEAKFLYNWAPAGTEVVVRY
jgi:LysM repeat protein